ncbi:hypothetical protein [Enterovirga rhinocerotis]|uniref:hypothetical protein n=1 Tax=Enterovirga rhinocerotis TaxID=1339210 RepID=UPI003CCA83D4
MTSVEPLPGHPIGGALCAKGRAAPELVHSPRPHTVPLRRTKPKGEGDPGWVEIPWDEAFGEVASRLGGVRRESGAVAFAVTTPSGTPMVDSSEWVERFVRCFGSPTSSMPSRSAAGTRTTRTPTPSGTASASRITTRPRRSSCVGTIPPGHGSPRRPGSRTRMDLPVAVLKTMLAHLAPERRRVITSAMRL